MQEMQYRGYKIVSEALRLEDEKWIGKATILPLLDTQNTEESALVFDNEEFDSSIDAESFALDSAEFYIDENF